MLVIDTINKQSNYQHTCAPDIISTAKHNNLCSKKLIIHGPNSTGAAEFMCAFMEVAHILIKWMKYRR